MQNVAFFTVHLKGIESRDLEICFVVPFDRSDGRVCMLLKFIFRVEFYLYFRVSAYLIYSVTLFGLLSSILGSLHVFIEEQHLKMETVPVRRFCIPVLRILYL
jgi:hypothetical protein